MDLQDIVNAKLPSGSHWDGSYKIPWDEPGFSRRMLDWHLSSEHDLASRRTETINAHVEWIHQHLLGQKPSRILDLACGPGLYSHRLAALGHTCRGLDFSPASIDYANRQNEFGDQCEFVLGDLRTADFGRDFDAALMIYGEFNAFPPAEANAILNKAAGALRSGGRLLIEAHTCDEIERIGIAPSSWYRSESGLFSDRPHLCLIENHWHESERVAEAVFYVIDAENASVRTYRNTLQGYTPDDYSALLTGAGFDGVQVLQAWKATELTESDQFVLLQARCSGNT